MLWKHPVFSLNSSNRFLQPTVKVMDFQAKTSGERIELSGKIISDQHAHTAVVINELGTNDEYWCESHSARIGADGAFQVRMNKPPKATRHYRIVFCLDNGTVTGDGLHVGFDNRGAVRRAYSIRDGRFEVSEPASHP